MSENEISGIIVDSAIEVHRHLGSGLLESVYERCLSFELKERGLQVSYQVAIEVIYKNTSMGMGYRLDLLVENKVIIELKCVEYINDIHLAQVLTYLKITNNKLALILNFKADLMKYGIKRVANKL